MAKKVGQVKSGNAINWFPGHMFAGMQAMIGKLNTVDCVIEVHDARIPFTGRNTEFREHLGLIKPRVLVLNKKDLADLSRWSSIKERLARQNDRNVVTTDLSGSQFDHASRGYNKLMEIVVNLINKSDRSNRQTMREYKLMIVGIPNVGKSTLINRLRQYHLGLRGEPATVGSYAGVTKQVQHMIKICSYPKIYSIDTPGVLEPSVTKNTDQTMRLALCSTISDKVIKPGKLAQYLLNLLNEQENYAYVHQFQLEGPVQDIGELLKEASMNPDMRIKTKCIETGLMTETPNHDKICWKLIKDFRTGLYGKAFLD